MGRHRGQQQASTSVREDDVAANQLGHPDTVDIGHTTQIENELAGAVVDEPAHPVLQLTEGLQREATAEHQHGNAVGGVLVDIHGVRVSRSVDVAGLGCGRGGGTRRRGGVDRIAAGDLFAVVVGDHGLHVDDLPTHPDDSRFARHRTGRHGP